MFKKPPTPTVLCSVLSSKEEYVKNIVKQIYDLFKKYPIGMLATELIREKFVVLKTKSNSEETLKFTYYKERAINCNTFKRFITILLFIEFLEQISKTSQTHCDNIDYYKKFFVNKNDFGYQANIITFNEMFEFFQLNDKKNAIFQTLKELIGLDIEMIKNQINQNIDVNVICNGIVNNYNSNFILQQINDGKFELVEVTDHKELRWLNDIVNNLGNQF